MDPLFLIPIVFGALVLGFLAGMFYGLQQWDTADKERARKQKPVYVFHAKQPLTAELEKHLKTAWERAEGGEAFVLPPDVTLEKVWKR